MDIDLELLNRLIINRGLEIEAIVAGTGYLPKTVLGVATFLLDNDGNLDLAITCIVAKTESAI